MENYKTNRCDSSDACEIGCKMPSVCDIVMETSRMLVDVHSQLDYILGSVEGPAPSGNNEKRTDPNSLMDEVGRQNAQIAEALGKLNRLRNVLCG